MRRCLTADPAKFQVDVSALCERHNFPQFTDKEMAPESRGDHTDSSNNQGTEPDPDTRFQAPKLLVCGLCAVYICMYVCVWMCGVEFCLSQFPPHHYCYYYLGFLETGFLCVSKLRDLPVSVSQILGLKISTTTPGVHLIV